VKAIIVEVKNPLTGEVLGRREFNTDLLREYLERKHDLGMDNFGEMLRAIFTPTVRTGWVSADVVDESGTAQTFYVKYDAGSGDRPHHFNTCYSGIYSVKIKVGDSDVAPSRDQYCLQGTVLGEAEVSASYQAGSGVVNITASFSWDTDQVVYEFGLFFDLGSLDVSMMLDRTVVSGGISVPAGSVLTITYQIAI